MCEKIIGPDKSKEIFDEAYNKLEKFIIKEKTEENIVFNKVEIEGKRIFIDVRNKIEDKIIPFWHLASQGRDELKYDMYPCENHPLKKDCIQECDFSNPNNFLNEINRVPCIYRASKIGTFIDIINIYNSNPNDERILKWTRKEKDGKHLKIRFIDKLKDIDYIIILKINYNKDKTDIAQYRLVTAYPVVLKSYKKRFDREYNEFKIKK